MQNGSEFTDVNKKSAKYKEVRTFLKENEHLLTWGSGDVVLDAGCGPGDVAAHVLQPWLPEDFRYLLGVDVSTPMVRHAMEHFAGDKVTYTTADIGSDLSHLLNDEKWAKGFDKVFSFFVLHWLHDLRLGLENLHVIMKHGAQALVVFPTDRAFQKTYRAIGTKTAWRKYTLGVVRDIPSFPEGSDEKNEFKDMLTSVGFEVIKCENWVNQSIFSSMESLKSLIESLNQDMNCIPCELRSAYLEDCVQELTEMGAVSQASEGQVILKQDMILAVFTKI